MHIIITLNVERGGGGVGARKTTLEANEQAKEKKIGKTGRATEKKLLVHWKAESEEAKRAAAA